jgi:RimJ/RimL family protein N-acetyltransferase
MADLEIRGEYSPTRMMSPHDVRKRFTDSGYSSDDFEMLLICDATNEVLGHVIHFSAKRYSTSREIGYMIYEGKHRGQGYATEAVAALIDYLFEGFQINRVECCIAPQNLASIRTAEKCGFVREGRLRGLVFVKGEFFDLDTFSVLRSDWRLRCDQHTLA